MRSKQIFGTAIIGSALLFSSKRADAQGATAPDSGASTAEPADDKKAEARTHFDLGLSHFDREEWQAALVEFLAARQLFPTKGNTKNAAIALRKVGRFAESLDMFETLVRSFHELSPAERALADREISELRASVGTVDVRDAPNGASLTVDGIDQGSLPLKTPLRLSAGNHSIRIVKDGYLPFEVHVDLAGRQAAVVRATLAVLTQAGRLRVTEKSGRSFEIVIDGSVVGRTPQWEGALAPGPHTVILRGEGKLGTQPLSVNVKVNDAAALDLEAEAVAASLSLSTTPAGATMLVDGVEVARGPWAGRLRAGTHQVEARLAGFLTQAREVMLTEDGSETVQLVLESAAPKGRPGLQFELDGALPVGLLYGGDVSRGCTDACSASVPIGGRALFHASYRFPSGWAVGVRAGYMALARSLTQRAATLHPNGKNALDPQSADDDLLLRGLLTGPEGQYDTGGDWPVTLRLGLGVYVGSSKDTRKGSFVDSNAVRFQFATTASSPATFVYVAPEVRLGRRITENFEFNIGVELLVMAALKTPTWDDSKQVTTTKTDGFATFTPTGQSLTGGVMIQALPGVGTRLRF